MGGKVIKKTPVIVLITVFVMLIIPTLAYVTLRSARVQTYLAGKAAEYLSRELGATISVGGVNIALFLNIVLEDVEVLDQSNQPLIKSKRMVFDISRISNKKRLLHINKILFDETTIQASIKPETENYNFQFLVDYFASDKEVETSLSPKWDIIVRSFEFKDASLTFVDHNADHLEFGFDINNFSFSNLDLEVKDILLEKDTLQASLKQFSFLESKGFQFKSLSADLYFSPAGSSINNLLLESDGSLLSMNIEVVHDTFKAFENFIEDVDLLIEVKPSRLSLYEVGYFVPVWFGLEGKVDLLGSFAGNVSNFRGNDIHLKYGALTQFRGNFNLIGLPVVEETFFNLSIEDFISYKTDIESFRLPINSTSDHISLPPELARLGTVSFKGNFTGFLSDFVAYGRFNTALGSISTNLAILSYNGFENINYKGTINSRGFNLGALTNDTQNFGKISLSTHLEGKGTNLNNLDLRISGQIQSLEFRKYDYKQLKIAGSLTNKMFNGNLIVDDPNLFLDFGGIINLNEELPLLNFTAQIESANLSALNIYQRDSLTNSILSTIIHVDGKGSNLANIEGEINAYSTSYFEKSIVEADTILINQINTDVIALENYIRGNRKELHFYSDFLDFQLDGELHYEKLVGSINNFFYTYAPARFKNAPTQEDIINTNQKAEFRIHLKNTQEFTDVFFPKILIAPHSFFYGHINTLANEFSFQGNTDYINFGSNQFQNPEISVLSDSSHLEIITRGQKLFITDSLWMEQFFTSAYISHDTITLLTQWENEATPNRNLGSIKTRGAFLSPNRTEFSILPSYAYINDSLWTFSPNNTILIDTTSIMVNNFHLFKENEFLMINGTLSERPEDVLEVELNNFNLESLAFLLGDKKVDFSGIASGELKLSNLRNSPNVLSELLIKEFAFNKDHLGDLSLESRWDALEKAFRINVEVIYHGNIGSNTPIIANGYFYPEREKDNFDLDITIENLKMSIFGRYLEEFASNFRGLASGRLRLDGPLSAPELSGRARLVRTGFRVDYLNTTYSFAHEIEVGKDFFKLDNLILNDTLGNSARVTGILRHNNFLDFSLDISLFPENMVVLNTLPHHNELFYGKAFASGIARVHGPVDDIVIDVSATANRGTQFFLPLDYYGEVTESSFISFVSAADIENGTISYQMPKNLGLSLNFDLTITPEAEIQIIFDSQIGDILRGRGFGNLKMEMDKDGGFFMYGDYTLQEGDYLFTLQNLINKRFRMEQGGTIRWTGSPYDADIDIRALYRLRTSLFDLAANQTDTSDIYRRRVPVETVLHLKNKLFNPSINFEIQLPGSDESTRDMIERLISTEQEMNRQVFSLLILNRFVPPEDGFNSALSYGMGSTSTELLSNQLSNWLSQISSDFDIGVNYRPGDEISSQEVELALSTQLFDDRVVIDGNLGVAGNHPAQTQRTSNIIGDVNVEVKITPEGKFRVKAFNRSNTFDLLNTNAPYTQGVGVFYRREFDNLNELFKRQKRTIIEIQEFDDMESSIFE